MESYNNVSWKGPLGSPRKSHYVPGSIVHPSHGFPSRPLPVLVALLWMLSNSLLYFLRCGAQTAHSTQGTDPGEWLFHPKIFTLDYEELHTLTNHTLRYMRMERVQRDFTSKSLSANTQSKSHAWRKRKAFPLSSEAMENDQ